jgi:hypothetical protein
LQIHAPGRNGEFEWVFMRQRDEDKAKDNAAQQLNVIQQPPVKRQRLANKVESSGMQRHNEEEMDLPAEEAPAPRPG